MMPNGYEVRAIPFQTLDVRRLAPLVGSSRIDDVVAAAAPVRALLGGRRVINVNSTATGGGVAELLQSLLGYVRHAGIDVEWLVIQGDAEFFAITKRIHNGLYGGPGDGLELGGNERAAYERVLAANHQSLSRHVRTGDVVIVHDPQTAGLAPALADLGAHVIWRCHVGVDTPSEWSKRAWGFVRPYVENADGFVFSRRSFAPSWIEPARLEVVAPSIDPFTPKNADLDDRTVRAVLGSSGLVGWSDETRIEPAHVVRDGAPPAPDVPLVVQVSRWDRMKDMAGVLDGFVDYVRPYTDAHLLLAGPAVDGVGDDPEARAVWGEVVERWCALDPAERKRVHLAAIPMGDLEENALVVNALQRHATVVTQKSLAEGFGLTVAEAMWKSRPVVASAVGGIVDQIVNGECGLLHDPTDLATFGGHITSLLEDPVLAQKLGASGRERIADHFLADRHLLQYAELLVRVLGAQADA
jgi:trehalose synthase